MTLLAGFAALLHRYTDQDDLPIGAPIAGRTRPETEPLIGFFVNTLVLRTNTHGNPSFRELIQRTRSHRTGRLRPPRPPLRNPRRTPPTPPRPQPQPPLPSHVPGVERPRRPRARGALRRRSGPGRAHRGDRRSRLEPHGGPGRRHRACRVRRRHVRGGDRRPHGGALPDAAALARGGSRPADLAGADAGSGRAASPARRRERDGRPVPGAPLLPPPLRGAGRADARGDRDRPGRHPAQLPGAGSARKPAGVAAADDRRRTGFAGRALRPELRGARGRSARRAQGGGRVRADGHVLAARPACLRARGHTRPGGPHDACRGPPPARGRRGGDLHGRARGGGARCRRGPAERRDAGRPRLRHLHVGLHRHAEGRDDRAPRRRQLPHVVRGRL